jgi:predicted ArsR family transcriptional regulator
MARGLRQDIRPIDFGATEEGPMRRAPKVDEFDQRVGRIAALGEPIRRALYRYVVAQPEPVSRDQAAAAVGIARHVAKFHLDRLEADGLLETSYSRPPGRGGPGAGRPAKHYRRSSGEVAVSLPARSYDLAGRVMARAIVTASDSEVAIETAIRRAAKAEGRELAKEVQAGPGAGPAEREDAIRAVLSEHGYEPRTAENVITLANCPFHALAEDYRDLVCGMNLDLIRGLLDRCGPGGPRARLDPEPDRCCVTLDRQPAAVRQPGRAT